RAPRAGGMNGQECPFYAIECRRRLRYDSLHFKFNFCRGPKVLIKTTGLTRRFNGLVAVNDVALEVPPRTIFGFIGPNGAGKTTTLRMLAALLRPTSGEIAIDGINPVENPIEVRKRIGYLSDSFGLYDDLKVWEYLDYYCGAYNAVS